MILLMEEIRRSPVEVGSLSHDLQGFINPRWCRISSTTVPPSCANTLIAAPGGYNSTRFPNATVVRSAAAAQHKANAGRRRYRGNRRGPTVSTRNGGGDDPYIQKP